MTITRNTPFCLTLLAAFGLACSFPAHAQDQSNLSSSSSPMMMLPEQQSNGTSALFGIDTVVLDVAQIENPKPAKDCRITPDIVNTAVLEALQYTDVPIVPLSQAKPVQVGEARITLRPLVATVVDSTLNCHSFLMLFASSRHSARIPPIVERRSFFIDYWHEGIMASSPQSLHDTSVIRGYKKLAVEFGKEFRAAQPRDAASREREQDLESQRQIDLIGSLKQKDRDPTDKEMELLEDTGAKARDQFKTDDKQHFEPFAMEPSRKPKVEETR